MKARPVPTLGSPVRGLRGVGPARAATLAALGVRTVRDLLFRAPRRYEVWEPPRPIGGVRAGEEVTVRGTIGRVRFHPIGWRRSLLRVGVSDGTGEIEALFFNQPYLRDRFEAGASIALHGRAIEKKGRLLLPAPRMETDANPFPDGGGIVPLYPEEAGAGQALLRSLVAQALPAAASIEEELPEARRAALGLPPLDAAVRSLHGPRSMAEVDAARRRLAFGELLELQRRFARSRARAAAARAVAVVVDDTLDARIRARFPFAFTAGQERALAEIRADLASGRPMRRLLQGEVGSGKTAVAAYAALAAIAGGGQAAFLAPTEILAAQHRAFLERILEGSRVRIAAMTASAGAEARRAARAAARGTGAHLVVGTHALLEKGVAFRNLRLAVFDEQHRFGVDQRRALLEKGEGVHALALTATPIPRTLAMAFYGDLDSSTIRDLPPGRGGRTTRLVPASSRRRVIAEVRRRLEAGERGFWVCPRIEDETEGSEARGAEAVFRRLAAGDLRRLPLALAHGRLAPRERDAAVARLRAGQARLLVCTSVVEVGVDVPEATLMVVEGAERFGLAALHQLRGRVGRGRAGARCLLLAAPEAMDRLRVLSETEDGFRISEEDLRRRGPGEVLGSRQSGFAAFSFADPLRDADLLEAAREEASLFPPGSRSILRAPRSEAALAPAAVPAGQEPCSSSR